MKYTILSGITLMLAISCSAGDDTSTGSFPKQVARDFGVQVVPYADLFASTVWETQIFPSIESNQFASAASGLEAILKDNPFSEDGEVQARLLLDLLNNPPPPPKVDYSDMSIPQLAKHIDEYLMQHQKDSMGVYQWKNAQGQGLFFDVIGGRYSSARQLLGGFIQSGVYSGECAVALTELNHRMAGG